MLVGLGGWLQPVVINTVITAALGETPAITSSFVILLLLYRRGFEVRFSLRMYVSMQTMCYYVGGCLAF